MPNPTEYPRCRTCLWWRQMPPKDRGFCEYFPSKPENNPDLFVYGPPDAIKQIDHVGLTPPANFGCILHEERGDA